MDVVIATFAGFVAAGVAPLIARRVGGLSGPVLAIVPIALLVYFCGCLRQLPAGRLVAYDWAPSLGLQLSFRLDGLSLLFALLITGVGAIVMIYAGGYLRGDDRLGRLHALLLAFMASMLGVVLADNFFLIFVFWELTSIISYLLIGFDHHRPEARNAALQAALITIGGGLALMTAFILMGLAGAAAGLEGAAAFSVDGWRRAATSTVEHRYHEAVVVLLLLGAFTKSAQFPFHFWLPGAMEAPTPVSAYLHSATMVKAGVYLVARFNPIFADDDLWSYVLVAVGAITMLTAALAAIAKSDLKQILAYSTVSALGMLMLLLGIGEAIASAAAVCFVVAHALYKGALFLVAGSVDHGAGTREVGELSGLRRTMPITAAAALLAALSMAALPPAFAFIAKEQILEATLRSFSSQLLTAAIVVGSGLFVAIALIVGVAPFWRAPTEKAASAHESSASMWVGPMLLGVLGLIFGAVPTVIDKGLLSHAAAAASGASESALLKLALWHGVNLPLALSGASLALGAVIFALRRPLASVIAPVAAHGPADVYALTIRWVLRVSELQTHFVQSGYVRYYLATIIVTTVAFVTYTAYAYGGVKFADIPISAPGFEVAICALVPLACWATIRAPSRLAALAALGVVGYSVALLFVLFGAPDLAMTQFLVETLTVLLFVFAFYRIAPYKPMSTHKTRIRDAMLAIAVGAVMSTVALMSTAIEPRRESSAYFVDHSLADGHGRNIVNVILVDFRAFDTLGEITVLTLAAVGVFSLLKMRPAEKKS